jgi:hypothetical protein
VIEPDLAVRNDSGRQAKVAVVVIRTARIDTDDDVPAGANTDRIAAGANVNLAIAADESADFNFPADGRRIAVGLVARAKNRE